MLRNLKIGRLLVIMALMIGVLVLPASAQNTTPGYTIVSTTSGIAIYQVNADGSQTQIFYVSAAGSTMDSSAGQGGGDAMMTTSDTMGMVSSDVISTGYLLVNTQALNVRSGPGAQYTVLATVAGGDQLNVVGRSDEDVRENWWYVELANGQRGWVNNIHVFIRGSLAGTPVMDHHGVLILPTLYIGYTGNPLFPSVPHQGVAVCYLPGKSEFVIVGRTSTNSFYQIEATCQDGTAMTGWIEAVRGIVRNPARTEFPITNK